MNKAVVSILSVLLVVGIAIGCIALVSNGRSSHDGSSDEDRFMSTQRKSVQTICQPTNYKEECVKSLSNSKSDDPKELVKAAIESTQKAIKSAKTVTDSIIEEHINEDKTGTEKRALEYCKQMLDSGLEDLQDFLDTVSTEEINLNKKFYDLWSWVSSNFAYQSSCLDDLLDDHVKSAMQDGMRDARMLSSNAMAIVKNINEILAKLGLNIDVSLTSPAPVSSSRRLLETIDNGLPAWVSRADRKLLQASEITPNVVVAKDGSGQYTTIGEALAAYKPEKNTTGRYAIYVKEGTYHEQLNITKKQPNVFIYGDGPTKTNITNSRNFGIDNVRTSDTGTILAFGSGFMLKSVGVENTAGPGGHQAVALMIQGDRSVVYNARLDGYQDTLYCNTGRQFYTGCYISGTVDFIFGKSTTVIQNSVIALRKGGPGQGNMVTADGKEDDASMGGIVIQNCTIVPHESLIPTMSTTMSYLGRPWKKYSTTVFMENEISEAINPVGWALWAGENNHQTCHYKEFNNRGPGSKVEKRVNWAKVVTNSNEVTSYTASIFLGLANESWLNGLDVPVMLGFAQ